MRRPLIVGVVPSIYPPYTEAFLDTAKIGPWEIIDNTTHNHGVAGSWNIGIDTMERRHADWLIIASAAVRFGSPGGQDLYDVLAATDPVGTIVVQAASTGDCGTPEAPTLASAWHLIALSRTVIDVVGRFDEMFWPAYFEDTDYVYRIGLARADGRLQGAWLSPTIQAWSASVGHGVMLAGIASTVDELCVHYERKWGGPPGAERWKVPFNGRP